MISGIGTLAAPAQPTGCTGAAHVPIRPITPCSGAAGDRIHGRFPHFTRWAGDPARLDPPPQTFEQILEWLLDGLASRLDD